MQQRRAEEEHEREVRARREAAAAAKKEAEEKSKRDAEAKKEARVREFRERRCVVEVMCQSLPAHSMSWEENPSHLLKLLQDGERGCTNAEEWLGLQTSRKTARRAYLGIARRWHPDKWMNQGEPSVAVANDVTKCLVRAYEHMIKTIPAQIEEKESCLDEDEDREVFEFASWVGIAFEGMHEVYRHRKGVKAAK